MLRSIRTKDLEWVKRQCYPTLIECEPGGERVVVLIEKANTINRSYRDTYTQLAIVVTVGTPDCDNLDEDQILINGELCDKQEIGDELFDRLKGICWEAAEVAAIGQGYFSDPDESRG